MPPPNLAGIFATLRARRTQRRALRSTREKISNSGLFDPEYYLTLYPDVALPRIDPLQHFIERGMREQRRPSLDFDPAYYLAAHPDVQRAGVDPLLHYIDYGRAEGRRCRLSRSPKLKIDPISPDVSIVIPAHCPVEGQLYSLLNCLDSLSNQSSRFSAEIIVAAESDELQGVPWIRCWKVASAGSPIDLLNRAAQIARGRFVVFLSPDGRVASGWLDELIGSFDLFPNAATIVSKICNENGNDLSHPKHCFARRLDSIPAVSFAVRANPSGDEIWLQPLSQIVYSSPRDQRDFMTISGPTPSRRLLVLDAVTPMPDRDSGSFITFKMLRAFQQLGYEITFISQHTYLHAGAYTSSLQRIGIECLYAPYFHNITDVLDYRHDFDVVLAYRYNVLDGIYDEIRRRMPQARIVFHNVDLHFLREEREAALTQSTEKRLAAEATRAAELALIAKVDCTIVHTAAESAIIKDSLAIGNIIEFPYIAEVNKAEAPFENRHDILFLGNFVHPPNIDAVQHFVHSIWPLIINHLPEQARFVITGPSPLPEIQSLNGPRIAVTGHVPDLKPCFEAARVFVAPLRYGAGIKGKVIQSLSYGTPSVITPLAAEGIGLTSEKETIIAESDAEFAEQVVRLYFDRDLWHSLQAAGYKFVEENFSWERCLQLCKKAVEVADATWRERHESQLTSPAVAKDCRRSS